MSNTVKAVLIGRVASDKGKTSAYFKSTTGKMYSFGWKSKYWIGYIYDLTTDDEKSYKIEMTDQSYSDLPEAKEYHREIQEVDALYKKTTLEVKAKKQIKDQVSIDTMTRAEIKKSYIAYEYVKAFIYLHPNR